MDGNSRDPPTSFSFFKMMSTPHYFDGSLRYRKTAQKKKEYVDKLGYKMLFTSGRVSDVCVWVCNIVVHRTEFGVA